MQVTKSLQLLATLIVFAACSNKLTNKPKNETSEFTVSRTKDGSTIIVGECFDFDSRNSLIPASLNINGIVLATENGSFKYNLWPGSYVVKVGFIGKEWASTSVKLNKGDSIHVKFFLKDDRTPLFDQ